MKIKDIICDQIAYIDGTKYSYFIKYILINIEFMDDDVHLNSLFKFVAYGIYILCVIFL